MNRTGTTIGIIAVIILAVSGAWYILENPGPAIAPEPVTISIAPTDSSALFYIAEDQHFFSDNHLAVTLREYNPPAAGVAAMLDGDIDLAGTSEYPVVSQAFRERNFSILTRYVGANIVWLIGRKDHGIANVSDLKGKTIGVARGTITEFNLGRFLTLHGMNLSEVTLQDVRPDQFEAALESGKVDALICWQPYADEITGRMGDNVVAWPAESGQPLYGILVARNDWISRHPVTSAEVLKSLDMAAEFTTVHPEESRAIVQKKLNLSDAYMQSAWPGNQFSLSLDQSLVVAMEDEARWMIANNMTNATEVPDFGDYIYPGTLESVRPGSVNLIR